MGVILNFVIALLISALVIWIVSKLNLGLTVRGYGAAIIAALVIAVVGGVILWLLGLLGITIGGGLLGAIVLLIVAAVVLMLSDKFVPGMEVKGFKRSHHRGDRHRGRELDHELAVRPLRHRSLSPVG